MRKTNINRSVNKILCLFLVIVLTAFNIITVFADTSVVPSVDGTGGNVGGLGNSNPQTDWTVHPVTGVRIYPVNWDQSDRDLSNESRFDYMRYSLYFVPDEEQSASRYHINNAELSGKNIKVDYDNVAYVRRSDSPNVFAEKVFSHKENGKTLVTNDWIRDSNSNLVKNLFAQGDDAGCKELIQAYLDLVKEKYNDLPQDFVERFNTTNNRWSLCIEPVIGINAPLNAGGGKYWVSATQYAKIIYDFMANNTDSLPGFSGITSPHAARDIAKISHNYWWYNFGFRWTWAKTLIIRGKNNSYLMADTMMPRLFNEDGHVGGWSLIYIQDLYSSIRSTKVGAIMDLQDNGSWKYKTNTGTFANGVPADLSAYSVVIKDTPDDLLNDEVKRAYDLLSTTSFSQTLQSSERVRLNEAAYMDMCSPQIGLDVLDQYGFSLVGGADYNYRDAGNVWNTVKYTGMDVYHPKTVGDCINDPKSVDSSMVLFLLSTIKLKDAVLPSGFANGTSNLSEGNISNMTDKIAQKFGNVKQVMTTSNLIPENFIGDGEFTFEDVELSNAVGRGLQEYISAIRQGDNKLAASVAGLPEGDITISDKAVVLGSKVIDPGGDGEYPSKMFTALWATVSAALSSEPINGIGVDSPIGKLPVSKYTGTIPVVYGIKAPVVKVPYQVRYVKVDKEGVISDLSHLSGKFAIHTFVPVQTENASFSKDYPLYVVGWEKSSDTPNENEICNQIIAGAQKDGKFAGELVDDAMIKNISHADFVKKVSYGDIVQGVCTKVGNGFDGFTAMVISFENAAIPTSSTLADINQQQLTKSWATLPNPLSISPSYNKPSDSHCSGHEDEDGNRYSCATTHSVGNWNYSVSENMDAAPDILGFAKTGLWGKNGSGSGVGSITPNIAYVMARTAPNFKDNPTNAAWIQEMNPFLASAGYGTGVKPVGTRIIGGTGTSTIVSANDIVRIWNFISSILFPWTTEECGSGTDGGTMNTPVLPEYNISTTLDKWTPKDITPTPNILSTNTKATLGSPLYGNLWFTDVSTQRLGIYPEVTMLYQQMGSDFKPNVMIGEKKRDFYPTGYFEVQLMDMCGGNLGSDSIAVDKRAKALQGKTPGYTTAPVIYSGGNIKVATNNNARLRLVSYTVDVNTNIKGYDLKTEWGNTEYSSLVAHNAFVTKAASIVKPRLYISVPSGEFKMNTLYNPASPSLPKLVSTYKISFKGGNVIDWGGLPDSLKTGPKSLKIQETLKQALETNSGTNPVGWYNENTTVIVVNQYESTLQITGSTAQDKLNITWGPRTPLDRNSMFSGGYGCYIKYKLELNNGQLPSPFASKVVNNMPFVDTELNGTRFIIPDASVNDMKN